MTSTLSKKHSFDIVFDSQKVFRLILDAFSNPARVVDIREYADKLYGSCPALLAVALTLLDNETSFCTYGSDSLADDIASLTLAAREVPETADFVFVCDQNDLKDAVERTKCGTLADPHKSATVIMQCDGALDQTVKEAIALRDEQNYEYPQGIDFLFVSGGGDLIGICRGYRRQ